MIIDIVLGRAVGRGGLEQVLTVVSKELSKRGHRVRVFQISEPDYLDWAGTLPEIYYYGNQDVYQYEGNIDTFHLALGYRNLISKMGKPDIVLATHAPILSLICRLALNYLGQQCPPIISWLHGPPEAYGGEYSLKYSDAHLAISYTISRKIKAHLKINSAPIYYIGNPVQINNTKLIKRPSDHFEFLYIGRLNNNEKRLDILLNALSNLQGNWKLRIIGDGPNRNELFNFASKLGVQNRLIWDGWKDQPWNEVNKASLLVLSSDYEGFGLVLVEALSRGIPVVSTDCDGPKEIIQDGINGWLYPIGDFSSLQNILKRIVTGEVNLPEESICRESIVQYRPENVVDLMEEILNTYVLREKIKVELPSFIRLSDEEIVRKLFKFVVEDNINVETLFSIIGDKFSNSIMCNWSTRLGILFWEAQLFDYVIPSFQKALEYDPTNDDTLFNLGYVLNYIGEHDLALQYFEKITNKNNDIIEYINQTKTLINKI